MKFPYCAACRKAPGKLCAGHGGPAATPQPAGQAREPRP